MRQPLLPGVRLRKVRAVTTAFKQERTAAPGRGEVLTEKNWPENGSSMQKQKAVSVHVAPNKTTADRSPQLPSSLPSEAEPESEAETREYLRTLSGFSFGSPTETRGSLRRLVGLQGFVKGPQAHRRDRRQHDGQRCGKLRLLPLVVCVCPPLSDSARHI